MTREEKQKAIEALKISAPVTAVTQEEFNNYIQILNQVMDWLEQEPRWIPVTEDAPPKGTICLWCNKQGRVFTSEIIIAQNVVVMLENMGISLMD